MVAAGVPVVVAVLTKLGPCNQIDVVVYRRGRRPFLD
jgi:hypothetical protein